MKYLLLILLAFAQVILVLVLSYKKHSSTSRMFMAMVSSVALWTIGNAILDYSQYVAHASVETLDIINRFCFFAGAGSLLLAYRLSLVFPVQRIRDRISHHTTVMGGLFVLLTLTPWISGGFYLPADQSVAEYKYGEAVALMGIFALAVIILAARNFLYGYRKSDLSTKRQAITIFSGLVLCILFGVTFTIIVPTISGNEDLLFAGYYAPFLFTSSIIYSIVKQRLFDFRPIVARSIGYVLSITFVAVIYGLFAFNFVSSILFRSNDIQTGQQVAYTVLAVITAFTFQPLQKIFNKLTNKIFYRDAYDTQVVLDTVSSVIVGNVDPHRIQKGALDALSNALRPTHIAFLLVKGSVLHPGDFIGQRKIEDIGSLHTVLRQFGKKITIYDELQESKSRSRDVLRLEDISAVSPLVTKDETIGYLVLGPKKSGNIYNSQDVGLLNIASNELAVALQNAQRFEEIQAFNITLQEKVTEATRELKRTNRKLVALDEAKDEFISMASHQLRTPLTSIKGYLSMLIEGDLGKVSAGQEKALKEAFGSSQRMVYLIADFLNVSRIKTGKFVIEPKEVDLPQIVTEEITQLREMASSRDITLEYESPGVFPRVQLDDNKIRQVMMNMVDNAIYYTPAGGKVTIQLYVNGEEVIFKVIDTGIGVPKREQHKLFTKFFRANNARKARPDGTGLGLFMAQKIIVEQGGAIIFESTEGKGSTFGFRFPLAKIKL